MIAPRPATVRAVFDSLCLGDSIASETLKLRGYQFGWWEQFSSDPALECLNTSVIRNFQAAAKQSGLAADTIETTISTIYRVLHAAHDEGLFDRIPKRPKRLHSQPSKTPRISLAEFDKFLQAIPEAVAECIRPPAWWQAFWGMIYFTALRLANVQQLEREQVTAEMVQVRQFKTGKIVQVPTHPVIWRMVRNLGVGERLFRIDRKSLYRLTVRTCRIAGIRRISPQAIRVLSARQFERAHPGAGRLVLGRPLPGADGYYFDPPEILRSAIDKLQVPETLMTDEDRQSKLDREGALIGAFRGMKEHDRETVMRFVLSLVR